MTRSGVICRQLERQREEAGRELDRRGQQLNDVTQQRDVSSWRLSSYSAQSYASAVYWIHFTGPFCGVHAFGYITPPKVNGLG